MGRLPPLASKAQNLKNKKKKKKEKKEKMMLHLLKSTNELHIDITQNHPEAGSGLTK